MNLTKTKNNLSRKISAALFLALIPGFIFSQCTVEIDCTELNSIIQEYKRIELDSGIFYTSEDNFLKPIVFGDEAVRISGNENTTIKRPDFSLGTGTNKDFRHGFYFVPANATPEEIDSAVWTSYNGLYEYTVITRGTLLIENLTIDCNMGRQQIQPGDKVEHSAMIRFNGRIQEWNGKKIMLAFERVEMRNIHFINGGAADNIYIGRGYFRPNISKCIFTNITEGPRALQKRGSITGSSTAQNIFIENCDLYKIELEESNLQNWDLSPGLDTMVGRWFISNSTFDKLDIAHKGHKVDVYIDSVEVSHAAFFYQVGGKISNSVLNIQDPQIRMNRLRGLHFDHVRFVVHPSENSNHVRGIKPFGQYGEPCEIFFNYCEFIAAVPALPTGALVTSEYSPEEVVRVTFINCTFDERMETTIQAHERGSWNFYNVSLEDLAKIHALDRSDIFTNACLSLN